MFHSYWETQLDGSCGRGGQTLARVSYTDRAEQKHAGNGLQLTLRFSFQPHLTPGVRCPRKRICYTPYGFLLVFYQFQAACLSCKSCARASLGFLR